MFISLKKIVHSIVGVLKEKKCTPAQLFPRSDSRLFYEISSMQANVTHGEKTWNDLFNETTESGLLQISHEHSIETKASAMQMQDTTLIGKKSKHIFANPITNKIHPSSKTDGETV
jgi:hypothetical protein